MTYQVDLKSSIKVQFDKPELAEEFFINSDWKEHFFTFYYLSQVAEHLAWGFRENGTDLEGFADFKNEGKYFVSEAEEYGKIYLSVEQELEVDYAAEGVTDIVAVV